MCLLFSCFFKKFIDNNKNGGVDKYHFKEYKQAQAKARKLRKNPNFGVSIYKVSKGW